MFAAFPPGVGAGILLYGAGVFFFAVNDALGKWLVADYSVRELMFLRAIGAGVVLGPLLWRARLGLRVQGPVRPHLVRVLYSIIDTFCFYYASRTLPLADVMAFYMATPLIVVALAAVLLGERVGPDRWLAVGCGFVGVLIVLRPGEAAFSPAALIALSGSLMFALTLTATRKLRATNWLTLVAYQIIGSGLFGAVTSAAGWVTPTPWDIGLMFAVGIVSMVCFMAVTKALALAPASLLAPIQYTAIVWAALMGWAVWGDVPGPATLLGVGIIIASGLFVLRPGPI